MLFDRAFYDDDRMEWDECPDCGGYGCSSCRNTGFVPEGFDSFDDFEQYMLDYSDDQSYDGPYYMSRFDDTFTDGEFDRSNFADPGGNSALRTATLANPRIYPCPTCGEENMLTPADVARGYQCDSCADAAERGWE